MFNKYYQDELTFLRELGSEFAQANPRTANLLSGRSADPDVERLLEGFSFLSGRIRQKLDDELPELTHALIALLWPHYLRPVPSMAITQFTPKASVQAVQRIERGTALEANPVDETACQFRTCYDVDLAPLEVQAVHYETTAGSERKLHLRFGLLNDAELGSLELKSLRLYFHAEPHIAFELYRTLLCNVTGVNVYSIEAGSSRFRFSAPSSAIRPVGFEGDEAIIPYPEYSFPGYRLLQEYFALPEKYLFVDINDLEPLALCEDPAEGFEIVFDLSSAAQEELMLMPGNLLLNCTPVVNLFEHAADPIIWDQTRTEQRIRPTCENAEHYEVFSVDAVQGLRQGTAERMSYAPFYEFSHFHREESTGRGYYQTRAKQQHTPANKEQIEVFRTRSFRESLVGEGVDIYISCVAIDGEIAVPSTEVISIELTCTNRRLPDKLHVGDICVPTNDSPEFASFTNITKPTTSVHPPLDGGLHWRLISHLSLNYLSLLSVEALRGILELYNFQVYYDQQAARENEQRMEGIVSIDARPGDWILRGAPIRGRLVEIEMDEEKFAGEGDMYLFASVLNEFFAMYCSMNTFTKLTVTGKRRGEVYSWPRRLGQQIVL